MNLHLTHRLRLCTAIAAGLVGMLFDSSQHWIHAKNLESSCSCRQFTAATILDPAFEIPSLDEQTYNSFHVFSQFTQCDWPVLFASPLKREEFKQRPKMAAGPAAAPESPASRTGKENAISSDESIAPVPPQSPEESLKSWRVREGFRVELVAAEPQVLDPVAIDWGLDGKLWVVEMADYPLGMDNRGQPGGRIRFLERSTADGPYDRSTVFLEAVSFPTGIVSWGKGVIVTASPEIFYAEDTDGDGKCDQKKTLFSGFNEGNQQLRINGLRWGLDGWLHCASGGHHAGYGTESRIQSHLTGETVLLGSRDFRFHPRTGKLEPLSGPSQFGRNPDDLDNWFGVQNSYPLWHYVLEDRYLRRNPFFIPPDARQLLTEGNPRVFPVAEIGAQPNPHTRVGRFTSACSGMIYRDNLLFPTQDVPHAFTCDPVHNLIQHNLLTRSHSSFTMQRDVDGEAPDFLASTDTWCRPVMVRTGPDGALWVVDMYRHIIEHPEWVPDSAKKEMEPFLRLGDTRGRIYRVLPNKVQARAVPDLLHAHPSELVTLLDHPNGWVRDAAQQRLNETEDPPSHQQLVGFLKTAATTPGRLHVAGILAERNECDAEVVAMLLNDRAESVRRQGLRYSEQLSPPNEEILSRIAEMVNDPSEVVQLQLACSLGSMHHPQTVRAFAEMWSRPDLDRFLEAALFSSLDEQNIEAVLTAVSRKPLQEEHVSRRFRQLVEMAVSFDRTQPLHPALSPQFNDPDQFLRAMIILDVHHQHRQSKAYAQLEPSAVQAIHQHASQILQQADVPAQLQVAAVFLLFDLPESAKEDEEIVKQLLSRVLPPDMQQALIRHLGAQSGRRFGELLLSGWAGYVPSVREQVLETYASQPQWHPLLVESIDEGVVNAREINLTLQQRFLNNPKSPSTGDLKSRFQSASQVKFTASGLQDLLKLAADPTRGKVVFQKHCADCHKFQNEGHLVGPNLSSVTNRTPATLFEAIIDPNKAIEPKYLNYVVALNDGRVLSGLIESDTAAGMTILKPKEEKLTVLRQEIDELRSSGKSLMPEGFDKTLAPQDLADLIQFLR